MRGSPTGFWGKLAKNDAHEVNEWHPLRDHCCDVACVAANLLALPTWRARFSTLARVPTLTNSACARLAVLTLFHDLGKVNLGFQAKGRPDLGRETRGHVTEAFTAFEDARVQQLFSFVSDWGAEEYLSAAFAHHGEPCADKRNKSYRQEALWQPRCGLDPYAELEAFVASAKKWFPAAFTLDESPLPYSVDAVHAFAGLVMLADWLASDTRFFPFSPDVPPAYDRIDFARAQAKQVVQDMGLDVPISARLDLTNRSAFARLVPDFMRPRPLQTLALDVPLPTQGSVSVLEAETGSGKTEAALTYFIRLYDAGLVDGLYFALPTRTAATQLHTRVVEATKRAFANPPPVVLAVPGYICVDDTHGQRLAPFEVLWNDSHAQRRGWASEAPKRYLAAPIAVGTIDQVLLSSLQVSHAHLRATSLVRNLLVVDEVHASDSYMTRILSDVLRRHTKAGGHALLLSATLGGEARARLLDLPKTRHPSMAEAANTAYPLWSSSIGQCTYAPQTLNDTEKSVTVMAAPWLENTDTIMLKALEYAREGAKVLVIANTVTECIARQRRLEAIIDAQDPALRTLLFAHKGLPAPHHSRFSKADRTALDQALEQSLGKTRPAGGCIVVATQTVQQSLDIDADILITDLCPMDVLLQRIGRLHRHQREDRPAEFRRARCLVVTPGRRDLSFILNEEGRPRHYYGLGSVYSNLFHLEATWRQIEAQTTWTIPQQNRALVEASLHSEATAQVAQEGSRSQSAFNEGEQESGSAVHLWQAHDTYTRGKECGETRVADLNLVEWPTSYNDMSFSASGERHVATRLGMLDRRVEFPGGFRGPFGSRVYALNFKSYWVADANAETFEASDVITTGAGLHAVTSFTFGTKAFTYSRFGLELVKRSKN